MLQVRKKIVLFAFFSYNTTRNRQSPQSGWPCLRDQKPSQTGQCTGEVFVISMTNQINECQ